MRERTPRKDRFNRIADDIIAFCDQVLEGTETLIPLSLIPESMPPEVKGLFQLLKTAKPTLNHFVKQLRTEGHTDALFQWTLFDYLHSTYSDESTLKPTIDIVWRKHDEQLYLAFYDGISIEPFNEKVCLVISGKNKEIRKLTPIHRIWHALQEAKENPIEQLGTPKRIVTDIVPSQHIS